MRQQRRPALKNAREAAFVLAVDPGPGLEALDAKHGASPSSKVRRSLATLSLEATRHQALLHQAGLRRLCRGRQKSQQRSATVNG
jgi:hypothetical protein